MILKLLIALIVVVNFITFASSKSNLGGSSSESIPHSTFYGSFVDDVNSVKDDIYKLGNDTSDTGKDFPSLANDVESLQLDFGPLTRCHQRHPFPFQDCYRDISVRTTKSLDNFDEEDFQDYKCELMAALAECINIKTRIYCGKEEGKLVKELTSIFKPIYHTSCNQTGIIRSHLVQFSI